MLRYRLELEPDDNGTVLVTSPDLPIVTYGSDEDEAVRHAADAIDIILQSMIDARESVPEGSAEDALAHTASLMTELKVKLHNAMVGSGLTRADLQRRLSWQRESVDRLFRLAHHSRLDQIQAAFEALGKGVDVDIRDAA